MIDVKKILYDITENKKVYDDNTDLLESGILDSFTFIELFSTLEDMNIELEPTRIDKEKLRSVSGIEILIEEYINNK